MLNKIDKIFVVYLIFLFIGLIIISQFISIEPDEGTHLLLSLFYKDLITNIVSSGDFSFESAYNFGISYLVHYPKLQITYPPLYHITTGFIFFPIFGDTLLAGRLCALIYSILSFIVFYIIIKKFFDSKIALLSTILFSLSTVSILSSYAAMADSSSFFFLLLAVFTYSKTLENNKTKYFILTGVFTFLSFFGKRFGGIGIIIFLIHSIWKKEKLKNILIMILSFLIPLIPYIFLLQSVGGLEINYIVGIGETQTITANPFNISSWSYYLITPITRGTSPFYIIFVIIFAIYIFKKEKYYKDILMWVLIFYITLSLVPHKPLKYFQYFSLPFYLIGGIFLSKIKMKGVLPLLLIIYIAFSIFIINTRLNYYPIEDISNFIYENNSGGNIAVFSEVNAFSSGYMFYLSNLEKDKSTNVYRSCLFFDKKSNDIIDILKDNSIYYIIAEKGVEGYENIEKIKNHLEQIREGKIELYIFREFESKKNKNCNYICLTEQEICSEFKNPYNIYKKVD